MDALRKIEGDLFDIADRLKEIDSRYELYRNLRANRFEIHANGALQIAVPFARLDARTLELARSTRLEYVDRLVADIEKSNAKLEKEAQSAARERIIGEVEKAL